MRTLAPIRPAMANVSGLPLAVIQMGGSCCTGRGKMRTSMSLPSPLFAGTASPRHSLRIVSNPARHHLPAVRKVPGEEREVVGVPAGRERQADAAAGEVVDDGPLLGAADRVVKREDDAPGAELDALGRRGDGGAGDRRVRVEPSERVEVALRRPYGHEAVLVGELRPFEEEAILSPAASPASAAK